MTTRVTQITTFQPKLKVGVGGNHYVISTDKHNLEAICIMIKKSRRAVVFHKKHQCWVIRVKSKKQKKLLKELFEVIQK